MDIEKIIHALSPKEANEIYDLRDDHALYLKNMASNAGISKNVLNYYYNRVADMRIKQHVNKEAPYLKTILQCYESAYILQ